MQLKKDQLTSQSRANKALFKGGITLPLLAALPWHLDPSWHGAVGAGQPHVYGAKRYTAHCSIQTGTLVLAAALESLATLVHHASKHTGGSILSCRMGGGNKRKVTILLTRDIYSLFDANDAFLGRSPVHTPMRLLMGAPKSQCRPLCGSQTSFSVHSSPICLAHTLQQPQPSRTRLTPGGH